jgi:hypothetical protein
LQLPPNLLHYAEAAAGPMAMRQEVLLQQYLALVHVCRSTQIQEQRALHECIQPYHIAL